MSTCAPAYAFLFGSFVYVFSLTFRFVELEHSLDPSLDDLLRLFVAVDPLVQEARSFSVFALNFLNQRSQSRHFYEEIALKSDSG